MVDDWLERSLKRASFKICKEESQSQFCLAGSDPSHGRWRRRLMLLCIPCLHQLAYLIIGVLFFERKLAKCVQSSMGNRYQDCDSVLRYLLYSNKIVWTFDFNVFAGPSITLHSSTYSSSRITYLPQRNSEIPSKWFVIADRDSGGSIRRSSGRENRLQGWQPWITSLARLRSEL